VLLLDVLEARFPQGLDERLIKLVLRVPVAHGADDDTGMALAVPVSV
jgi:hypothetical protein